MEFDSKEEEYFFWWLGELTQAGIIIQMKYQPKAFRLFSEATVDYEEQLKTKTKKKSVKLLANHEYTADFLIYWDKSAKDILFVDYKDILKKSVKKYPFVANYSKEKDCYFSVVDVKGTFNQNDAWRRFSIDQKWVFQKFGIYVQKIITHPTVDKKGRMIPANALFPNTFIPRRFQLTDRGRMKRKIKYEYKFADIYLKENGLR